MSDLQDKTLLELEELLTIHRDNLQKNEIKAAKFGPLHTPSYVMHEMQDDNKRIQDIKSEIERRKHISASSAPAVQPQNNSTAPQSTKSAKSANNPLQSNNTFQQANVSSSGQQPNPGKTSWIDRLIHNRFLQLLALFAGITGVSFLAILQLFNTSETITYRGKVVNINTGNLVSNAKVTLQLGSELPIPLRTDNEGIYSFEFTMNQDQVNGEITVDAQNQGYELYRTNITVEKEQPQLREIQLVPRESSIPTLPATPTPTPLPNPKGCYDGADTRVQWSGASSLSGWAEARGTTISELRIVLDGAVQDRIMPDEFVARPDVALAGFTESIGWSWQLDTTSIENGEYELEVQIITEAGNNGYVGFGSSCESTPLIVEINN